MPTFGLPSGAVPLAVAASGQDPQPLGTTAVGTQAVGARSDHVHPLNRYADIDGLTYNFRDTDASGATVSPWFFNGNLGLGADGRGFAFPAYFRRSITVNLGVQVSTAAAGSVIRLGLYADDATNNRPGALVADLSTVDSTTTGLKWTTSSVAATKGVRYWMIAVAQGGAPSVFQAQMPAPFVLDVNPSIGNGNLNTQNIALRYTSIAAGTSTALPATAPAPATWDNAPLIFAKIA